MNSKTAGERFYDEFLSKYPESQWPSYIDEIAIDLSAGIGIGTTQVDLYNFPRELGPFYRKGMLAAAGSHTDIQSVLADTIDESDLGTIVLQLNRLGYDVEQSGSGLNNVQEAVEAVLEKLLTKETGLDFSTQSRQGTATIADVVMEMFSEDAVAQEAETLVEEFEASLNQGLLSRLDEPLMMTPLWTHQLDALKQWKEESYRGYADMATATGKTVLGLAAIALRYGNLHPIDDVAGQKNTKTNDRDQILVVAHSDLILEQWRREFDNHLNIPPDRTQGSNDIELTWGDIHFRTPQRLLNQSHYPYDLVILDEAHHYATGSDWGSLLEHFDGDILALSGSVDDAGTDSEALQERLGAKVGPEIKRYSITEAQRDGIIPAFDWEVRYAPFESDDEFVELSQSVDDEFEGFQVRLQSGEIETDRRLETFDDVRTFSHTSEGKELKRSDSKFRSLSTGLFSRRMKRWHLAPSLNAIAEIVVDHRNDHVIVLVDSNAQVQEFSALAQDKLPTTSVQAVTKEESREELRDRLDRFDSAEDGGVLVGTGDLLGEGVDIPQANVAVNMATGGVNAQLVQRIGRVLRNPSGDKHAHFYNVVGVPSEDAIIPPQDGRRLIENAAEFCALGGRFNNLPGFATAGNLDDKVIGRLLDVGAETIESLIDEGLYDWPVDENEQTHLEGLFSVVSSTEDRNPNVVLGGWGEYSWYESSQDDIDANVSEAPALATIEVIVETPFGDVLQDAELSIESNGEQDATIVQSASGGWTVTLRGDGTATLEATHPDYESRTKSLTVDEAPETLHMDLEPRSLEEGFELDTMADNAAEGILTITVHDQSGTPVEKASISLAGSESVAYDRTDSSGVVRFARDAFGETVRVAVRHPEQGVRTTELEFPYESGVTVSLS